MKYPSHHFFLLILLVQTNLSAHDVILEPEMVKIPRGSFIMGCMEGRDDVNTRECPRNTQPAHRVNVSAFSISRTEITLAQYRAFLKATPQYAVGDKWKNPGFTQSENHPVIYVNWHDAQAYLKWLSEQTGKPYRLPSEAEWEYAARSNTETMYPWGNILTHDFANYEGTEGSDEWEQTAPVGSFPSNIFGLRDMHGNVFEWVQDCWHNNYQGAPTDGSVWKSNTSCNSRLVRGGAWKSSEFYYVNSFARAHLEISEHRDYGYGFRVVCSPSSEC